jgi:hypothetical protein
MTPRLHRDPHRARSSWLRKLARTIEGRAADRTRQALARAPRNAVHVYRLEAFLSRMPSRPRTVSGRLISLGTDQHRRHYSMPQRRRRRHGLQPDRPRALELLADCGDGCPTALGSRA